jgi:hypothetical protein
MILLLFLNRPLSKAPGKKREVSKCSNCNYLAKAEREAAWGSYHFSSTGGAKKERENFCEELLDIPQAFQPLAYFFFSH